FFLTSFAIFVYCFAFGQKITGVVTNYAGNILPFSSIQVKETGLGTTANADGVFSLKMTKGSFTITCQHVGYEIAQQNIIFGDEEVKIRFQLKQLQLTLSEVVVKKGEDPAYEIIRAAIKKRPSYKSDLKNFTTKVYTKGIFKLRDFPKKFFGQKVDFEDGDTNKKKTLYLSESVARYSVDGKHSKIEVLATKVSGQTEGFGLSTPQIISFYENNIQVGQGLNPRGFISPIADNALNFYRYKYEGAFFENGREISHIRVIPKRKFEPLFNGYINIVENEWRIHSLQLTLLKDYGMQTLDTLRLEQLYSQLSNGTWVLQNQVIYPALKMFAFDAYGSFANVYSEYDLSPSFPKSFFDRTVLKYVDSSNKKSDVFWEESRPIALQKEEVEDYRKKDSLEQLRKSPAYLDSIDRRRNKFTFSKLFLSGISISQQKSRSSVSFSSLIDALSYNTVEGVVVSPTVNFFKRLDTVPMSRRYVSLNAHVRYGFSNHHLNPHGGLSYGFGKKDFNNITVSGGSNVFQFNNDNPVNTLVNTITTLFSEVNRLKIYEARFARLDFSKRMESGLMVSVTTEYQDRLPLENTTDFTIKDDKELAFTPNYPIPLTYQNIQHHQAFALRGAIRWQPGVRYVEFPDRKIPIGSKSPVFRLAYTQGLPDVFGSDVKYSKWNFNISDNLNLKLFGALTYQFDFGGFLNRSHVETPDYIHFRGNDTRLASNFGGSFQLVPAYYFSTVNRFYSAVYTEHHFNGLITNKIPLIKNLKWNLVGGANALYIQPDRYYLEPFIGLENIFRILRVDYVVGLEKGGKARSEIRFGLQSSLFSRN
ncbi:MAG: hypothetical protein JWP88_457, partial [Flaviaesturariibacter sp.]|nr:hypothetical protein [Flaviaesturariibacter sp.]